MRLPDEQFRAGHIPAELYRQIPPGTDMTKVVFVQEAPRSYTGPIVLTLVITTGAVIVLLTIVLVVQIIAASIIAVLSATCGLGYSINRAGKHGRTTSRPIAKGSAARRRPARSRPRPKNRYRK